MKPILLFTIFAALGCCAQTSSLSAVRITATNGATLTVTFTNPLPRPVRLTAWNGVLLAYHEVKTGTNWINPLVSANSGFQCPHGSSEVMVEPGKTVTCSLPQPSAKVWRAFVAGFDGRKFVRFQTEAFGDDK